MPHTRSVSVLFFVTVGSCYEPAEMAGISHFIEHVCFKGTHKRPDSRSISEAIEGVGGIMNGGTDREITSYWCKLASKYFGLSVDVMVDVLRDPLFREDDIDKEKQVIIEEINMSLDSPQQRVGMVFDELMWPGSPMGRDVAGTRESVTGISGKQLREFLSEYYTPANILVSVAGDCDEDAAAEAIWSATRGWGKGKAPQYLVSATGQQSARMKVEHRDTEQVNMLLGVEAPSIFDPDRFAADLLCMMLGEGMSSRLFTEIREKLGLTYDIHSYIEHYRESGAFVVHAGIEPAHTAEAVRAILDQLASTNDGVSEEELVKAKEMTKGRLLLSMENSRNVAGWYGAQEILTGKIMTVDEVTAEIEKVTQKDIVRVAQFMFRTDKLNLAMIGPIDEQIISKGTLVI